MEQWKVAVLEKWAFDWQLGYKVRSKWDQVVRREMLYIFVLRKSRPPCFEWVMGFD